MQSQYEQRADTLLEGMGVKFSATLIGSDCPRFCEDRGKFPGMLNKFPREVHIHGKHYECTCCGGMGEGTGVFPRGRTGAIAGGELGR